MKATVWPAKLAASCAAVVLLAAAGSPPASRAADAGLPESVTVPLHVERLGRDEIKIGIELRLGGGPELLFELDTGSAGLYGAYSETLWPSFEPAGDRKIVQSYGSDVELHARPVRTTVAFASDHGEIAADVEVARITEAYGGPLGPKARNVWQKRLDRGRAPLYGRFFGILGSDLREHHGLFAILPQLPGNLSSGFVVHLGCADLVDPSLTIGLTDPLRSRFPIVVPMQPGSASATFPGSGLPTYSQKLVRGELVLVRGGTRFRVATDAILDTGAPTANLHQAHDLRLPGALVRRWRGSEIVRPYATFDFTVAGAASSGPFTLAFATGTTAARNLVKLGKDDAEGYVNLGLIPFLRYDVMFDVEHGVVGFAPCSTRRRRSPVLPFIPAGDVGR